MKEFIKGTNWKWKFYEWKNKYLLYSGTSGKYYVEVIPSIFYIINFYDHEDDQLKEIPLVDNMYEKLMDKFFCPLVEIDKPDMIEIALEVLNKMPGLRRFTLLGWTQFEDKTKDPNYYGGTYIFPDGNKYTITLYKGFLSVFPGEVDAVAAISLRLPLVSKEINLQQWVDRRYKNDKNALIKFK